MVTDYAIPLRFYACLRIHISAHMCYTYGYADFCWRYSNWNLMGIVFVFFFRHRRRLFGESLGFFHLILTFINKCTVSVYLWKWTISVYLPYSSYEINDKLRNCTHLMDICLYFLLQPFSSCSTNRSILTNCSCWLFWTYSMKRFHLLKSTMKKSFLLLNITWILNHISELVQQSQMRCRSTRRWTRKNNHWNQTRKQTWK